jgi:hypothetical protein
MIQIQIHNNHQQIPVDSVNKRVINNGCKYLITLYVVFRRLSNWTTSINVRAEDVGVDAVTQ